MVALYNYKDASTVLWTIFTVVAVCNDIQWHKPGFPTEWQPECHPRSGACFNSSPLGPSPCRRQMTAGYLPVLIADKVTWHSGDRWKKMLAQKANLDRVVKSQWLWNSGEKRTASWARIPGRDAPQLGRLEGIFPRGQSTRKPGRMFQLISIQINFIETAT